MINICSINRWVRYFIIVIMPNNLCHILTTVDAKVDETKTIKKKGWFY